jgi:polyhydroxybutyrate depolymerase
LSGLPPFLTVAAAALLLALAASAPRLSSPPVAAAATCSPLPHAGGAFPRTIVSSGVNRDYHLYVPASYDGVTALPLVLNFHGLGSNIAEQVFVSDLYSRADAQGFFVATAQGLPTAGLDENHWNNMNFPPNSGESNDVQFVSDIIDDVAAQACLDVARVYSTGMSNGAQMSVRLACSLSGRVAAIAPVSAVYYPPMSPAFFPGETCPDTRPVPLIAFHGTADGSVPFNGGVGTGGFSFRDIDDVVMPAWAAHNGCNPTPATSLAAPGIDLIEYSACTESATVRLYVVFDYDGDGPATAGGGHDWPGSPYMPTGHTEQIEATDLMLAFFEQYMLPCAVGDADCDSRLDAADNCPAAYNPGQQNADANFLDLAPKPFDDLTRPNSDTVGDACDTDDDNDGRSDADEASATGCAGHITDPGDADTDGDNFLDGAECALGADPTSIASKPLESACAPAGDADGDGISDRREVCYYNTDPSIVNTDGDLCSDGREVASINANAAVDVIDLQQVASETGFYTLPGSAAKVNFDVTKNAIIDVIDLQQVAARSGPCP